ncbi:MAG: Do family serine endopeptidase [Acidobacteria bacterium]|nr:Do family serine endopeptidase [Acidobacteriota bacterium]
MTRSSWIVGFGALAVTGVVTAGVWTGTAASTQASVTTPGIVSTAVPGPAGVVPAGGFADVVARVTPGVVTITTERRASPQLTQFPEGFPFGGFFGQRGPRGGRQQPAPSPKERGLGSGVIVTTDGYILTNNHVVENSTSIKVELSDRRVVEGKLIGADALSDLAVVKIDATNLPVVAFGDSSATRVGDVVLAVGNPLGVGQTVTMGIVSAKGRATGLGDGSFEDFLQTDAPINQGNSGGALVNTNGQLVGINSQILSPSGGNIGIGFAVPSNMAKNVMDQLVAGGKVHRGKLGVTVQELSGDLASGLGLDGISGALVSDITPGSAAATAGVKRGDVILSYQGHPVRDSNSLRNEVAATKPGSTVTLEVQRDGKKGELTATLDELAVAANGRQLRGEPVSGSGKFGMTVEPVTPDIAAQLELPTDATGVVISDLDPSGAAAGAGLREGDVIQQVDGKTVRSGEELKAGLDAANDRPAVLLVTRGGARVFVPLRAPRG